MPINHCAVISGIVIKCGKFSVYTFFDFSNIFRSKPCILYLKFYTVNEFFLSFYLLLSIFCNIVIMTLKCVLLRLFNTLTPHTVDNIINAVVELFI